MGQPRSVGKPVQTAHLARWVFAAATRTVRRSAEHVENDERERDAGALPYYLI
jgi:hypothetical protein